MPLQIAAALAVKKVMEQQHLQGTLKLWPGVAEELLGTKAYFVRAGAFKDVDICIFAHVGSNLQTSWGDSNGNGMVSVEYTFKGESAHAAGRPWRGRSALDAVELMDIGWNFRREHLRIQQRSHYVFPMAAISRTWCRRTPRSGTTSAKPATTRSRSSGRSATTWRRPPP
jgi:aminobenzoyl-glutamate utilization protein B